MRRAARYGSGRRARSVYARASLQPAAPVQWIVGARTFIEGSADTFDIQPTGPLNYTQGGVYDVDGSGDPLPAGMTLSDSGVLFVGSAGVSSADGVVFGYNEPGALPLLTLSPSVTGTLPYMAAVYPLEGAVPAGMTLTSTDDATLRGSVLSAWEDGSAKVVVVAGHAAVTSGVNKAVRVKPGPPQGGALTTAAITAALAAVSTNFGAPQALVNFNTPDRVWWANSQVICAQYHLDLGLGLMQAIIYVHAFAGGRCFVEVMIENGKIDANAANPNSPVIAQQVYTAATVAITPAGGAATTIATVSSPTAGMAQPRSRRSGTYTMTTAGHERGRAWYCNAWTSGATVSAELGAADPQIDVTHDTLSLQNHPWFFKPIRSSTEDMATKYAQTYDTYVPWAACRLRMPGMQGGGDDQEIALWTGTQSDYIITGHKAARKAVINTGLAMATAAIHFRHTDGTVPTAAQARSKSAQSNQGNTWPKLQTEPAYGLHTSALDPGDSAHSPAIALVPFLCRPSPVFIEQAWKEQVMCCSGIGRDAATGAIVYAQSRGRYWRHRNLAICIFLTPDTTFSGVATDDSRKAGWRTAMLGEINYLYNHYTLSWNVLHLNCSSNTITSLNYGPGNEEDHEDTWGGIQTAFFMQSFGAQTLHAASSVKVMTGADQTKHTALADLHCQTFIDWMTAAPDGDYSWRALPYHPTVGWYQGVSNQLNQLGQTWWGLTQFHPETTGTRLTAAGQWLFIDGSVNGKNWANAIPDVTALQSGNATMSAQFQAGLFAAIERGLPGADTAWTRLWGTGNNDGGITNLQTYLNDLSVDPKFNHRPRNK